VVRRLALLVAALVAASVVLGLVFAGSPTKIASGVRIDGVDVGGLETKDARRLLEHRSATLAQREITFTAAGKRFRISPAALGVEPDWKAAIASAQRQGNAYGPLRGFKRLDMTFFGADVTPRIGVLNGALEYELGLIADRVNRPAREAAVVRRGTRILVLPAQPGVVLDRTAAASSVVHALASLDRPAGPVSLPLRTTQPHVRAAMLAGAAAQARRAFSAPVQLVLGPTRWLVRPQRLAQLIELPAGGRTSLRIAGTAADDWLRTLGARVAKPPADATFAVDGPHIHVVPAQPGVQLDALASTKAILEAALRPRPRVARLVVVEAPAKISTKQAQAMGIRGLVSTYTTEYGGVANRIHNVQLVAHLVDGKLIAPGATFSFNGTTGERNAAKGFLVAPVIVNGEVTTGLGGGVCQVSTTVFNAAFEAGLKITARTNHALYISHYPQGRDATVNYPDTDLKFVNDTPHWLLLRTFVGSSSLTVNLYGTPTGRKVESTTAPLVTRGAPPVKKTVDPTLKPGETVVDYSGVPAMSTSVSRKVYEPNGKLLYDDTWYSSYSADPALVRVGPPRKKQKPATSKTPPASTQTTTQPTQ
jgi:vancomycin resistance protein YoaR